ncbi:histone-fold-containing protein [Jimgerdemannia flammicorona]|uniref:Histone H4 n=1 Tax=Jimgerdemannia flammicorona TaxID=994334 RepID=A0A433BA12_9FUNG|nr:histone-fold-containing protein [Jimgerdemannia flammicorona]
MDPQIFGSKGGKRFPRYAKETIKGISKPAIHHLACRGGIKCIESSLYDEVHYVLKTFLRETIGDTIIYTEHAKRKTITTLDIVLALKKKSTYISWFWILFIYTIR